MKVGKALVGRVVELIWRDPVNSHGDARDQRYGMAALAQWKEYGVIDRVEEGVVKIIHGMGANPDNIEKGVTDEVYCTDIHEALIEKLTVYSPGEVLA